MQARKAHRRGQGGRRMIQAPAPDGERTGTAVTLLPEAAVGIGTERTKKDKRDSFGQNKTQKRNLRKS